MRKTSSALKTESTRPLSSRLEGRSVPNGFSTTTRRQRSEVLSAIPVRCICLRTTGNMLGGMDR